MWNLQKRQTPNPSHLITFETPTPAPRLRLQHHRQRTRARKCPPVASAIRKRQATQKRTQVVRREVTNTARHFAKLIPTILEAVGASWVEARWVLCRPRRRLQTTQLERWTTRERSLKTVPKRTRTLKLLASNRFFEPDHNGQTTGDAATREQTNRNEAAPYWLPNRASHVKKVRLCQAHHF